MTADDGERVLELALQHDPVLIILDIMMPRVDGYTVVVRLRGHPPTRHIPVIMITGRTEPWFPLLSADMGVLAHLQKPFTPEQLLEAVRAALGPGGASPVGPGGRRRKRGQTCRAYSGVCCGD